MRFPCCPSNINENEDLMPRTGLSGKITSFIWRKWNQLKQVHQEIFERVQKQTHQGIKGLSEGTLNQPHRVTERSMGRPL